MQHHVKFPHIRSLPITIFFRQVRIYHLIQSLCDMNPCGTEKIKQFMLAHETPGIAEQTRVYVHVHGASLEGLVFLPDEIVTPEKGMVSLMPIGGLRVRISP